MSRDIYALVVPWSESTVSLQLPMLTTFLIKKYIESRENLINLILSHESFNKIKNGFFGFFCNSSTLYVSDWVFVPNFLFFKYFHFIRSFIFPSFCTRCLLSFSKNENKKLPPSDFPQNFCSNASIFLLYFISALLCPFSDLTFNPFIIIAELLFHMATFVFFPVYWSVKNFSWAHWKMISIPFFFVRASDWFPDQTAIKVY